ncbi:2-hydroxyacid dehydrogenase [Actinotalea sp. K2]|uniref:2-hydroxyacid dehydrogenase n=1 Tax=Actinotalea sp. K2 TaxID=2939438 RepID=UPI002017C7EF|nr:2-hydroxyacid dehydrogenase [Actinotalea sp. K2]MCL3861606.1 2-hydroxyacid dehydrogenase [Actinotalea sp. K2]
MKVIIADANLRPHRDLMEAHLPPGVGALWFDGVTDPEIAREITDAEVFVGSVLPRALADGATALRLVHAAGAGTDGIDRTGLRAGVRCANTYHHEASIAEYVAASLVVLRRRTLLQDAALRAGVWSSPVYDRRLSQPATLRGAVATFLGFGHIGQHAWNLLRCFGVEGIAITASGSADPAEHGLRWVGTNTRLHDALAESEVLVISIPLVAETEHLVRRQELDLLGTGGLLVNVARGRVVHEGDLYEALRDRRIAGAALDVWYQYPTDGAPTAPSTLPFSSLENVVMTPHSSGITTDTFRGRVLDIADNITRLHDDRPLQNEVRPR